jgi:hypothetical protein
MLKKQQITTLFCLKVIARLVSNLIMTNLKFSSRNYFPLFLMAQENINFDREYESMYPVKNPHN